MEESALTHNYDIIGTPVGFLVGSGIDSEYVEVQKYGSGYTCECFSAQIDGEGRCEHIEAVELKYRGQVEQFSSNIDQARADFYLGQIGSIDSSIEQNRDSAKIQINQIQDWLESVVEKDEKKKSYYEISLDNWMRSLGFKTKSLAHGVIKLRQQQPEIIIKDESLLLKDKRFVRTIPEKEVIDKSALRKHVINTGEEVAGIRVNQRDAKFTYTTTYHTENKSNDAR
jgi:phage host-nuclease inhibitor protein Gam